MLIKNKNKIMTSNIKPNVFANSSHVLGTNGSSHEHVPAVLWRNETYIYIYTNTYNRFKYTRVTIRVLPSTELNGKADLFKYFQYKNTFMYL